MWYVIVGQFCGIGIWLDRQFYRYSLVLLLGVLFLGAYNMARSPAERARAVEVTLTLGGPAAARRILRREWGRRGLPTLRTLERWVQEFREGRVPGTAPLFPFKLQLAQRLKRGDKAKRQRFCRWLLDRGEAPASGRICLLATKHIFT